MVSLCESFPSCPVVLQKTAEMTVFRKKRQKTQHKIQKELAKFRNFVSSSFSLSPFSSSPFTPSFSSIKTKDLFTLSEDQIHVCSLSLSLTHFSPFTPNLTFILFFLTSLPSPDPCPPTSFSCFFTPSKNINSYSCHSFFPSSLLYLLFPFFFQS